MKKRGQHHERVHSHFGYPGEHSVNLDHENPKQHPEFQHYNAERKAKTLERHRYEIRKYNARHNPAKSEERKSVRKQVDKRMASGATEPIKIPQMRDKSGKPLDSFQGKHGKEAKTNFQLIYVDHVNKHRQKYAKVDGKEMPKNKVKAGFHAKHMRIIWSQFKKGRPDLNIPGHEKGIDGVWKRKKG